jgi:hypothetical protein
MKEVSVEMAEELEAACAAWLEMAIKELIASAKKNKVELTGQTIASIAGSIVSFSPDGVGEILINFQNSGRFQDWRKMDYGKLPPIDVLTEWVEKIGINKFKFVPGYKGKERKISDSQAARRIAWGVAMARYNRGPKRKKRWFAKLMYGPLLARLISAQIEVLGTSSLQVVDLNLK